MRMHLINDLWRAVNTVVLPATTLHFYQLIILPLTCRTNYYKIQMACFLIQCPQGLFRNYSDAFLPVLKPHMERLADDSHESTQRCVAEIIAGLVRGSKHWSFGKVSPAAGLRDATKISEPLRCLAIFMFETPLSHTQVEALWAFLIPLMRTALSKITVETYADWGTCVATACVCHILTMLNFMPHNSLPEPTVNDHENIINGVQGKKKKSLYKYYIFKY